MLDENSSNLEAPSSQENAEITNLVKTIIMDKDEPMQDDSDNQLVKKVP